MTPKKLATLTLFTIAFTLSEAALANPALLGSWVYTETTCEQSGESLGTPHSTPFSSIILTFEGTGTMLLSASVTMPLMPEQEPGNECAINMTLPFSYSTAEDIVTTTPSSEGIELISPNCPELNAFFAHNRDVMEALVRDTSDGFSQDYKITVDGDELTMTQQVDETFGSSLLCGEGGGGEPISRYNRVKVLL